MISFRLFGFKNYKEHPIFNIHFFTNTEPIFHVKTQKQRKTTVS